MVNLGFTSSFSSASLVKDLLKREASSTLSSNIHSSTVSTVKATSTNANGCVSCPSVKCPDCGDNFSCVMTSLTCTSCPITYCVAKTVSGTPSSAAKHKTDTGAIVGGVVGGVVGGLLVLALIAYFFKRNKKKAQEKRRLKGEDEHKNIFADDDLDDDDMFEFDDSYSKNHTTTLNNTTLRSSNLEKDDVLGVLPLSKNLLQHKEKRNDETSSVSTENASNIIPIGYIPGIKTNGLKNLKTGPKRNIPDELKSHYTLGSSILGDLKDDEEDEKSAKNMVLNPLAEEEDTESDFAVLVTPAKEVHQTALRGKVSLVKIDAEGEETNAGNDSRVVSEGNDDDEDDDDDSVMLDIDVDHQR